METSPFTVQPYQTADLPRLADFFAAYRAVYADAKLRSAEFYTYHPSLEDRQNVWCVLDARQQLVGFAPMFPVLTTDAAGVTAPHEVWLVILARPDDAADGVAVALCHLQSAHYRALTGDL